MTHIPVLRQFAQKYIWWMSETEAMTMPERVMAQVMDIGDYKDVQVLARQAGDTVLRQVLQHAGAGQFSPRSWHYWHYRLGLATHPDEIPPLPVRRFE